MFYLKEVWWKCAHPFLVLFWKKNFHNYVETPIKRFVEERVHKKKKWELVSVKFGCIRWRTFQFTAFTFVSFNSFQYLSVFMSGILEKIDTACSFSFYCGCFSCAKKNSYYYLDLTCYNKLNLNINKLFYFTKKTAAIKRKTAGSVIFLRIPDIITLR